MDQEKNSSFTLEEKEKYYKNRWKKNHISIIIFCFIIWLGLIISLKFQNNSTLYIGIIAVLFAVSFGIMFYYQMKMYVKDMVNEKIKK